MASSTRASRAAAFEALASSGQTVELAVELFAASNALQQSAHLRSLLSDPSAEIAAKEQMVQRVFGKKLGSAATGLVTSLSKLRWSATRDLPKVLEQLGVRAIARSTSDIHKLQAELFLVQQLVSSESELELALSSNRSDSESKQSLIAKLLGGRVSEDTLVLCAQALESQAVKGFAGVLGQYAQWIAEVAAESIAEITVAKELSDQQLQRLGDALSAALGKRLQLNVAVDPSVIGGVHVAVGGEVIDATVITKLNQARLQLA